MYTFDHFNFNVTDLDKSLAFYKEALGLEPTGKTIAPEDGSFVITYLGDGRTRLPAGADLGEGPPPAL